MKKCTGIIMSNQLKNNYGSLSQTRPDYMLPFGSRYRIIDFALSNVANYNLSQVMLYAGKNVRSTLDHLGNGENWELNRRSNGLLINPPSFDEMTNLRSEIVTYYDSLTHYEYSNTEVVYVENPMTIAKINLSNAYEDFLDKDYDVMLVYKKTANEEKIYGGMNKVILDSSNQFVNVGVNLGTEDEFNLYLGRVFLKKEVFMSLVKESVENANAQTLLQAIMNHRSRLKIGTYEVSSHVEIIHDTVSYYRANLNLLNKEVYDELFYKGGMVYTKSKDEPSSLYKEGSKVTNSLIANGAIIEGQVENSIIFRGVRVHKNAVVRNSVLIQKTIVGENAVLVNTITDKYSQIEPGVAVAGAESHPFVVGKNEIIER